MQKKKILLMLLVLFIYLFPSLSVQAKTNKKIVLTQQFFDGNRLYYIYQLPTGKTYTKIFPIEERTIEKAKQSKNSIQVVKNDLIAAYTILDLEDRLDELQGISIDGITGGTFTIDPSLQETFQKEWKEANRYAVEQMNAQPEADRKKRYDTSKEMYQSYQSLKQNIEEDTTFNEVQKEKTKTGVTKESSYGLEFWGKIGIIILFFGSLFAIVYYKTKRG